MPVVALTDEMDWTGWRHTTRALVLAGVAPSELSWTVGGANDTTPEADGNFTLSRTLVALAAQAFQIREVERYSLLYTLIWRAHHGELTLSDADDPDLRIARRWALAVRADAHRMRTHIRFIRVTLSDQLHFLGWYQPDHFVLEANARLLA